MDGQRFDELTKALASGSSRRALIRGIAVGAAATLGRALNGRLAVGAQASCRDYGRVCDPGGAACCTGTCRCFANGHCRCTCADGHLLCRVGSGPLTCADLQTNAAHCGACGIVCPSGVCRGERCLTATGGACAAPSECVSESCVDGVCCDTACTGQCEACNLTGSIGMCAAVTGAPLGGRPACASDGSICGGACDGFTRAACVYPTSACGAASCTDGVATPAVSCAAGACPAATTQACSPYRCGATACLTSCASDGDCIPGGYCDLGTGQCQAQDLALRSGCTRNEQCASSYCVDGVCCDTACTGQCEACNVAGSVGTCVGVSGEPVNGRPTCGGPVPGTFGCKLNACNATTRLCEVQNAPVDTVCVQGNPCQSGATCQERQLESGAIFFGCISTFDEVVICDQPADLCQFTPCNPIDGTCGPNISRCFPTACETVTNCNYPLSSTNPESITCSYGEVNFGPCDEAGGCPSGATCCSGTCRNLTCDINNCGACGNVCDNRFDACRNSICVDIPDAIRKPIQ